MMQRHTILLVDDEPDVLKSLQALLRLDHRILTATQGSEAIKIMESEEIHVIMSDQRMPQMTGVEFLSRVRGSYPDAIRLLFTGYADLSAVIDAINQGSIYRYITKPCDPEELQSIIREACERYDLLVERRQLLDQVRKKNVELETANAALQRSNELKTAFIKVVSHELRTPLAILLSLTSMAQNSTDLNKIIKDWPIRAHNAAERLNRLVDQIVTQLQADQFEGTFQRQPVDIAELLRQAADDVRPFVERRHQTLTLHVPADLGLVQLDSFKIHDAINHLLLNAIKFTPDGGCITLTARGRNPCEIEIRDSGVGIEPAALAQLFQPFFTEFDVSHHSSGQFGFGNRGLGLGLSTVKAFIEMHGGTIRAESQPGKGTTFFISL